MFQRREGRLGLHSMDGHHLTQKGPQARSLNFRVLPAGSTSSLTLTPESVQASKLLCSHIYHAKWILTPI